MNHRICPPWIGYFLLNPLRKWVENPDRLLRPLISEGMTVLEPGCGMGFFTLPIARMVGPSGRVVAVDIQAKMLSVLARRAEKAGLTARIDFRQAGPGDLNIDDFTGAVDIGVAIHMVHEMPDQRRFFSSMFTALKAGGTLFVIEPKGHVTLAEFQSTEALSEAVGFIRDPSNSDTRNRRLLTRKPSPSGRLKSAKDAV